MLLRMRIWAAVLLAGLGMSAAADAQTVVVTIKPLKDLTGDLEYLVKAIAPEGDPGAGRVLETLRKLQEGGLIEGLDRSRGLAAAALLSPEFPQGNNNTAVVAVPVTDYGKFMESLKGMGLPVEGHPKAKGYSHEVTLPIGEHEVLAMESKGYALFTPFEVDAEVLRKLDPASWASKAKPGAAIAARVDVANLPEVLKEGILDPIRAQLDRHAERQPGETEPAHQARVGGLKAGLSTLSALLRDGDAISLALDIDRKAGEMSLELSAAAKPDTAMAKALRAFQGRRSRFEATGAGVPLAAWASLPMSKAVRDGLGRGLQAARRVDFAGLGDEQEKLLERLFDLIQANLDADDLDAGIALRKEAPGEVGERRHTMITGLKVRDGKAFDRLFRDAVGQIKAEGVTTKFDVLKAADGTTIHEIIGPFDADPAVVRMMGHATLAFAFRDDAILGAFGSDAVGALRQAAEDPRAKWREDGPAEPVAIVARLADFGAIPNTEAERATYREAAAEAFRGDDAGRDRIGLTLRGEGDAIGLRFLADVPTFKFLARVGRANRK